MPPSASDGRTSARRSRRQLAGERRPSSDGNHLDESGDHTTWPFAQRITERLVWTASRKTRLRSDTLLATTAAVLCLDHDGADGRTLDDHLTDLAHRDDIVGFIRGILAA